MPADIPTKTSSAKKTRDLSFDAFRGFAILLVAIAHAGVLGWSFKDSDAGYWNYYYSIGLRQFALCALPIFLTISGYWLGNIRFESKADYSTFIKKRLTRILIPYLFWSCFFYGLSALRGFDHSLPDFLSKLLTGRVEDPYFYLLMLIQFYLLTPVFIRLANARGGFVFVVTLHIISVAALYGLRLFINKDISFTFIKMPCLAWLSFFYLGVVLRSKPDLFVKIKTSHLCIAAVGLFIFSLIEGGIFIGNDYFELGISDIKFTSLLYGAAVVILFFNARESLHWPRWLAIVGDYSFGIYFIHGFFLRGAHKALAPHLSALYDIQPLYQLAIATIAVVASCFIIFTTRKIIGKDWAGRLFGF
jgi:peptidoglycan/LPS O-acetylase OafA/YrhL